MAQTIGQRVVGAEGPEQAAPAVAVAYTTAVLVPSLSKTTTVSHRYRREIATVATAIDQLARGESSSAADTLAQWLKALETAVRDSGSWDIARWVELVPAELTLVEAFEAEAQQREQTRTNRSVTLRERTKTAREKTEKHKRKKD